MDGAHHRQFIESYQLRRRFDQFVFRLRPFEGRTRWGVRPSSRALRAGLRGQRPRVRLCRVVSRQRPPGRPRAPQRLPLRAGGLGRVRPGGGGQSSYLTGGGTEQRRGASRSEAGSMWASHITFVRLRPYAKQPRRTAPRVRAAVLSSVGGAASIPAPCRFGCSAGEENLHLCLWSSFVWELGRCQLPCFVAAEHEAQSCPRHCVGAVASSRRPCCGSPSCRCVRSGQEVCLSKLPPHLAMPHRAPPLMRDWQPETLTMQLQGYRPPPRNGPRACASRPTLPLPSRPLDHGLSCAENDKLWPARGVATGLFWSPWAPRPPLVRLGARWPVRGLHRRCHWDTLLPFALQAA